MKNFFYSILGIVVISTTLYSAPNSGIQIIPIGGGSSGSLSITGAYNFASPPFSTNGVNVSISLSTSNLAGILSTNLYSQISIDPRMRRLANRPIPMGWAVNAGVTVAAGVTNQSWMIGVSEYLNTNGFAKLGYDTILFNCGALSSNRNASGELQINTNYFPLGGPGLVSAFASNNCYLGIFAQIRPSFGPDECGGSCITPATAYFDGYTLAKWGLRMVWIGDIQNGEAMSDESIRYSCEQFVAGLDAGTAELRNKLPVNVTVSWTGISALRGTISFP